jgi:hypothetical protein
MGTTDSGKAYVIYALKKGRGLTQLNAHLFTP